MGESKMHWFRRWFRDGYVRRGGTLDAIRRHGDDVDAVPRCNLAYYRECVRGLPRPSDGQVEEFIRFVCSDHSWYKKLPMIPPGVPFQFFLDPLAGYTRLVAPRARVVARERPDGGKTSSYRHSTNEYRSRFGYLACDRASGVGMVRLAEGEREYGESDIFCAGDRAYRIPLEVADAGTAEVTGVVHPLAAREVVWLRFHDASEDRKWPEETGGDRTLREIMAVCAREHTPHVDESDELSALMAPERRRVESEMRSAIHRMLDLVA